jgi:hypothetical protein
MFVIRQFGSDLFRDYKPYKKNVTIDPAKASDKDRERFSEIDEWMQGTRIQD